MKLEVGMYVRTLDGISKVVQVRDSNTVSRFVNEDGNVYFMNEIMCNPSFDVIDLVEVKDIIEIDVTDKDNYSHVLGINFIRIENERGLSNIKDMISNESAKLIQIVTHEQFEQMSYKVGE